MHEVISKILAKLINDREAGLGRKSANSANKKKVKKTKNIKAKSLIRKQKVKTLIFLLALVVLASVSFIY